MPVMMIIAKADFDIRPPQNLIWQSLVVICDGEIRHRRRVGQNLCSSAHHVQVRSGVISQKP